MVCDILINGSNTQWIQPRLPDTRVRGFFSCRSGGVSKPPFSSLNVGLHVTDDDDDVIQNRRLSTMVLGGTIEDWVVGEQVHGCEVRVIRREHQGRGSLSHNTSIKGVDALITNEPGISLVIMAADCVPLLFVDPVKCVIGVAHSGWKGTVGHIARRTVEQMSEHYGCDSRDIYAVLGPSIRRCCYEVDERVALHVRREFEERYCIDRFGKPGKFWLSLQACIHADLLEAGLLSERIDDVGICTSCRSDSFFSHRKENGRTGRHFGAIRIEQGTSRPS